MYSLCLSNRQDLTQNLAVHTNELMNPAQFALDLLSLIHGMKRICVSIRAGSDSTAADDGHNGHSIQQ